MHHFDKQELQKRTERSFQWTSPVRFQDVDAAGIVFFARFAEYVHDAYVALLDELGTGLATVLRERSWAAPIRHVEIDYFRPVRFGDRVTTALVAAHVADTEVALGWQVLRESEVVAVAQTVHTFVDPGSFQRIPVPEAFLRFGSGGSAAD